MTEFPKVAVIGAGLIGASWAALFLASGRDVAVHDPAGTEASVRDAIERAWPALAELGLVKGKGALSFHASAADAARTPISSRKASERIPIKHALYGEIEPVLEPGAVVASSASGLTLSELQAGWQNPGPLVLGHPFNPPHLIPLVEIMGNDRTAPGRVEAAEWFYKAVGKVTIRVNREVPGHVANRLQAALWREATWDCEAGRWSGPGQKSAEVFNVIEGSVCVTRDSGVAHDLKVGDTMYIPKGAKIHWKVDHYVKKAFVIMPHIDAN